MTGRRDAEKSLPLLKGLWKEGPAAGGTGPVVVSLTDFKIDRFRDLPSIALNALRIRRGWDRREGSVGLTLWVQPLRRRLGSLSAWEGERDLSRWLGSDDHRHVVKKFSGRMHNVSSAIWQSEHFVLADAWAEAGRRRAAGE